MKLYKAVDPIFHSKPVLGKIREDQMEDGGSSSQERLTNTDHGTGVHYRASEPDGGGTGEELAAVLPLVRHALEACADNGECSTRPAAGTYSSMYIHKLCKYVLFICICTHDAACKTCTAC